MPLTIRRAARTDADPLHELAARTFGLSCPPGMRQSDIDAFIARHLSRADFDRHLVDPDRIVLIAEADGAPVGYSMLARGPIADPAVAALVDEKTSIELSKFYLAADRHGSGAAARLMADTLAVAAGTGAESCWLGVNQQNVRAAKFYAKHGFRVVGVKRFLVGDQWCDDHVRLRPLDQGTIT